MKFPGRQRGVLMFVTLVILLVVSWLGMSTMDTTGLEMQMSSNSRAQQAAFEAAEYTLSWVENNIQETGFTNANLTNVSCGSVCFDANCTNGYCFSGTAADSWANCVLNSPATEFYESAALWADSDRHRTLTVPNIGITVKYIIEFRCYTALDPTLLMDVSNYTRVFRVTAFATGPGGRARSMLRSTMKEL